MTKLPVLLVDDEPQVLTALEDILCDHFIVHKTESADQALKVAQEIEGLAVVITDQRMPKTTGDELVSRLAPVSSATRILLTGFADLQAVIRAVNCGHIFSYITKPWNPDDLVLKVREAAEHFRLSKELDAERRLFTELMDSVSDGICFKDTELRFVRANRSLAAIVDVADPDQLIGKRLADVVPLQTDAAAMESEERQVLTGHASQDVLRALGPASSRRWYSESVSPTFGRDGKTVGLVGILRDVTERKEQQERILRLTRLYAVLSEINAAIARTRSRSALLLESCRIAVEVGEFALAVVLNVEPLSNQVETLVSEPNDPELVAKALVQLRLQPNCEELKHLLRHERPLVVSAPEGADLPAGDLAAAAICPLTVPGEQPMAFCLFYRREQLFDSEEMKLLTELTSNITFALDHITKTDRLDFLAYHDELTGLPNRALFVDRVKQHAAAARNANGKLAVLLVDIGRFRQVNETLGRAAGDKVLIQIARRIGDVVPERDTLARFDSNTFAILLAPVNDEHDAAAFAAGSILPALKQPFTVDGTELKLTAKVGIALYPSDGENEEVLVANAEAATKNAKRRGQNYLFYAPTMHERVAERLTFETRLRQAVEAEAFELFYQPKVDLRTGIVVGLEALMRWRDPSAGMVMPAHFIPLLEETGLIHEVGKWAIARAARQAEQWRAAGLKPPRIAVNVSAVQLSAPDLVESLEEALDSCPSSKDSIDLEITESVFVSDLAGSVAKLEQARLRGLQVAIDDFGTGYSSLGYLSRLPIDALKIDRSFIMGVARDPQETAIVTTIISLAHAMDLKVIAEGVETSDQAQLLRLLKCDQMQGYLVSRPQPASEIEKLLSSRFDFKAASA
jgi:diguanylate cyclase (GGDEF)-like protein/PAS domain S-box-containing protein